ncbi:MAG: tetratricopeptide repeat protein [Blastocatellia bacterium]
MKVAKKSLKDKIPEMIAYWENKEFLDEESQDYLNSAKEALKNNELSNAYNWLGSIYFVAKDFDKSEMLFEQVGHYAEKEDNPIAYAISLINLGELHTEKGEVLDAELNFVFCQQFLEGLNVPSLEWLLLRDFAELYVRNGMIDLAESFVNKIIKKNKENQKYTWESIPQWLEALLAMVPDKHQLEVKNFITKVSNKIDKQVVRKSKKGKRKLYAS